MAKLLLVEDDNNLREIYEARLQAEGYQIVSARDGEEALVVAKAEKPDLVISDVMMPKISGFEMLDILRNTDGLKEVKVIMLTALGQSDDQKRADKLGADRYLVKSQVTLEDIVKTAHELLGDEAAATDAPAAPAAAAEPAATPAPAAPAEESATPVAEEPKPAPDPTPAPTTPEPVQPAPIVEEPVAPAPEEPKAEPAPPVEPAAPAEEPKPAPEPTPAPVEKPAADSKTDETAKSTVQEEADMEAKIEDFVAGASSEPTAPAAPASTTDTASDGTAAAPADDTKTAGDSASDDKLMADAVNQLVASTGKTDSSDSSDTAKAEPAGSAAPSAPPAAATPEPPAKSIPVSVAEDTPPTPAPKPAEKPEGPEKPVSGSMGHDKIIQPPEHTGDEKDIQQLLAEEEAKESQSIPGTTIPGIVASDENEDKPAGAPAPSPSEGAATESKPGGVDPNSIAL